MRNAFLLSKVIERGIAGKDDLRDDNILKSIASKETLEELLAISDELFKKAGLMEMNEKLKTF